MRTITLDDRQVNIYDYGDFPYSKFSKISTVEKSHSKAYADCVCTFDIETTSYTAEECNVLGHDFGFMYVWQFCIEGVVCAGRTWAEYRTFIDTLKMFMGIGERRLVVYVHNLSFEFQFMRNFFTVENAFATEKRNVVYAVMEDVEYRCSYRLSNMGLAKFLEKTKGVTFNKLDGSKFNYKLKRFPDTELSEYEWAYAVCDVLGLCEAIKSYLTEDNLCTIPITSTGFVRRDYREVCLPYDGYVRQMRNMALEERIYVLCREASRGAIAGSNHINTDEELEEVDSHDIKSSYPYQMLTKYFPMSKFVKVRCDFGSDKFDRFVTGACCIIVWSCDDLILKRWEAIPYISKAKCRAIKGARCANGKVYSADRIGMCCTEIDLDIITRHYDFKNPRVSEMWVAQRGMLPVPFRQHLQEMFQIKTDLEDGDRYMYDKYKNKINASFGMMLTDILHSEIVYVPNSEEPFIEQKVENIPRALHKYYYNDSSFLSYQHGIWVLAHGRSDLVRGMDIVGRDVVQVDTDSVKNTGDYKAEFQKLNSSTVEIAESFDVKPYAYNKKGEKVYLGIWEHENLKGEEGREYTYKTFKSLGAKKYAYTGEDGKVHVTVSGLRKSSGSWFDANGGLKAFSNGVRVPPGVAGRTASTYVDMVGITTINVEGHEVTLGANIAIKDVAYTLSMTGEWVMMILSGKIPDGDTAPGDGAFKGWLE